MESRIERKSPGEGIQGLKPDLPLDFGHRWALPCPVGDLWIPVTGMSHWRLCSCLFPQRTASLPPHLALHRILSLSHTPFASSTRKPLCQLHPLGIPQRLALGCPVSPLWPGFLLQPRPLGLSFQQNFLYKSAP